MRSLIAISLAAFCAGCVSSAPVYVPQTTQQPAPRTTAAVPPPQIPRNTPAPPSPGFRAPQVMNMPGLEGVIGSSARDLERRYGKAKLDLWEGDARKLQYASDSCVLDIYLYPLEPGAVATATQVEARRPSDGQAVDRAACLRTLPRG